MVDLTLPTASHMDIHIPTLNISTQHKRKPLQIESKALQVRNLIQTPEPKTMLGSSSCLGNTHRHRLHKFLPLSNANNTAIPCQSCFPCNVKDAKVRNFGFKVERPRNASCLVQQQKGNFFEVGCASWSLVSELERQLEAEMNTQEDEEEGSVGMTRFRHKCGERKGVVEILECLEREAIMGEDVGKEPMDYNRRAQIFDRSSRVFQALKELNSDGVSQP